jgi:hypothetical protein
MADGDPLVLGLASNASNAATELSRTGRIHNTALTVRNGNGSAIEGLAIGRDAGVTGRADLGEGLRGLATNGLGVYGQSDTWIAIHGVSQDHPAFVGFSKNSAGAAGVSDGAGDGVVGAAEGTGNGVIGWSLQNRGVWGTAALAPGVGVDGISPHIGVRGVGGQTGVHGQGKDTGVGVQAVAANNDALVASSVTKRGVVGLTQSGSGVGVHGVAFPPGAAPGTGHTGVMGSTAAGFGILGTANTGYAGGFAGPVIIWGNLTVIGTKSAAVPHPDGSYRLTYCTESPESWFEDFGRARLANGSAEVRLHPDFAAIVRTEEFHVFLTAEGETQGLYVSRRGEDGFEVREQGGGTSDATFSYRVVARRRDVDAERLAVIELPQTPPVPDMPDIALSEIPEPPASPRTRLNLPDPPWQAPDSGRMSTT